VSGTDALIFGLVVALRLLIPLGILRYPLPAIIAALVIDAADQTIFQQTTNIDLEEFNYQGYDKALDIYYLAIAYIATFRNWRSGPAVLIAAGLWYYRLVGVTLFELTQWRPLLILFPNTFEYFFIFMAAVRLQWDDRKLSARTVAAAAAAIWVFIKLPQEYWIHIAQLDFTDFVKEDLLGSVGTASWGDAFGTRPVVALLMAVIVVAALAVAVVVWRRLPSADYPLTFDADNIPEAKAVDPSLPTHWGQGLGEKILLISLTVIIFSQALETDAAVWRLTVAVTVIVASNAVLTQWLRRDRGAWTSTARAFGATLVLNIAIYVGLGILVSTEGRDDITAAVLLLLLTLIVTLFDRYRSARGDLTVDDVHDLVRAVRHRPRTA